jgi:hypothetical protein
LFGPGLAIATASDPSASELTITSVSSGALSFLVFSMSSEKEIRVHQFLIDLLTLWVDIELTKDEMETYLDGIGMPKRIAMFAVFELEVPDQVDRLLVSFNSFDQGFG